MLKIFIETMKESLSPETAQKYYKTGTAVFIFLGAALGSVPIVEISSRLFGFELHGFPKMIVQTYRAGRDHLMNTIIDAFSFSLSLPFLSDLIVIYIFFSFCIIRGSWIARAVDHIRHAENPEEFREQLRSAAKKHNQNPNELIAKVEKGMERGWRGLLFYHYRALRSGIVTCVNNRICYDSV